MSLCNTKKWKQKHIALCEYIILFYCCFQIYKDIYEITNDISKLKPFAMLYYFAKYPYFSMKYK